MINLNNKIEQFQTLIQDGAEKWIAAGKLLIEMEAEEPTAMTIISKKIPVLSIDRLEMFKRIGNGELNPMLLADPSPGAMKLLEMPRKVQDKYLSSPIEIAVVLGDQVRVERKPLQQLTRPEADIVFNATRMRSPEEQVEMLRNRMASKQYKFKPRYIIDGEKITFLARSTFTVQQLMEVIGRVPKPDASQLESALKSNQIK